MGKGKAWVSSTKVTINGMKFDSKAEAEYYYILKGLLDKGKIARLDRQVCYKLPNMEGKMNFRYTVDFVVEKLDGTLVYLEVKGRFLPGNKIRYAYWQYYYRTILTIVPTNGPKKFHLDWLN